MLLVRIQSQQEQLPDDVYFIQGVSPHYHSSRSSSWGGNKMKSYQKKKQKNRENLDLNARGLRLTCDPGQYELHEP